RRRIACDRGVRGVVSPESLSAIGLLDQLARVLFPARGDHDDRDRVRLLVGVASVGGTPLEPDDPARAIVAVHLLDSRRDGLWHRLDALAPRAEPAGRLARARRVLRLHAGLRGDEGTGRGELARSWRKDGAQNS